MSSIICTYPSLTPLYFSQCCEYVWVFYGIKGLFVVNLSYTKLYLVFVCLPFLWVSLVRVGDLWLKKPFLKPACSRGWFSSSILLIMFEIILEKILYAWDRRVIGLQILVSSLFPFYAAKWFLRPSVSPESFHNLFFNLSSSYFENFTWDHHYMVLCCPSFVSLPFLPRLLLC